MRKILTYYWFVLVTFVVVMVFVNATNYAQLAIAVILYPLLAFCGYKICPEALLNRQRVVYENEPIVEKFQPAPIHTDPINATAKPDLKPDERTLKDVRISDIDKRLFLKLIGGTGISLLLLSLFNNRSENLFTKSNQFGTDNVPFQDDQGNKINPARHQPLDGYVITEVDDSVISYYGFTNGQGSWYVMKIDTNAGSFRYANGNADFPFNWKNRKKLKYEYFNNVFN